MKTFDSYNSSYPLAYYEIGEIYSFYGSTTAKGTPASEQQIAKFASVLMALDIEASSGAIKAVGGNSQNAQRSTMNRFYAVVTDKVTIKGASYIKVMFCNKYNGRIEYYTKTYSVNHGCETDGKDLLPTATHLGFESSGKQKVGGITLVGKTNKVGGITLVRDKGSSSSVGGITKVRQETASQKKVGGITLVRKKT